MRPASWFSFRRLLVGGKPVRLVVHVALEADSVNGVVAILAFALLFVNSELSINLLRPAGGASV